MIIEHAIVLSSEEKGTALKRDQAYAALYQEIVRLRLAPGAIIDESALNRYPDLGRTPIREALHQLASEGLVTIYPRRGMVVTPITLLDVQQQTEARLVLEPNVVRLAAKVGTAADWDALEALLADAPAEIETEDDVAQASNVDRRFHHGIAAVTGNRYLAELVDRLGRMRARMPFLFFRHGTYQPVTDQHIAILAHLRAGDAVAAGRLVENHIKLTQERQTRLRL